MENFLFVFLLKRATFLSRALGLYPMYPVSYVPDISHNYIPVISSLHSSYKIYIKAG